MGELDAYITMAIVGAVLVGMIYHRLPLLRRLLPLTPRAAVARMATQTSSPAMMVAEPPKARMAPSRQVAPPDMWQATRAALARLPKATPLRPADGLHIPILFDGIRWHTLNLSTDLHWGVFGTTGSGKGNFLQHLVLQALHAGPKLVQVVIIDWKAGVDYTFCKHIEHATLYKRDGTAEGLTAMVRLMNQRLDLMEQVDARNMPEYNAKVHSDQQLPWVIVVADEIGDASNTEQRQIETLARMARAAGIILFVSTQYPTVEVLSSQIQANVPNRVVFRVVASSYSGVALRRQKADPGMFEPAAIPKDLPGVAVLRTDGGDEALGRVPHITDYTRWELIAELAAAWTKPEEPVVSVSNFQEAVNRLHLNVNTGIEADTDTVEDDDTETPDKLLAAIREAAEKGVSSNTLTILLRMNRNKALRVIKQARGTQDAA